MELFDGDNFTGHCVEVCEDCPFLQAQGLSKDKISSIKVYGDGAYVSLHRRPHDTASALSAHTFAIVSRTKLRGGA